MPRRDGAGGNRLGRKKVWGSEFKAVDVGALLEPMNATIQSAANSTTLKLPPPPKPIIRQLPDTIVGGGAAPSGGGGGGYKGAAVPGDVKAQMKAGFMRAGRKDLADMVDDPDFHTWINAESSWRDLTSAANNQGKPNYGYFQFWAGHPWARPGIPADEQAYLAATKFKLSPERIRGFAGQIRAGRYKGWG